MRELVYRQIYPDSGERQLFSGAEFVGILGRAEDFKEGDPANAPAKELYVGTEPIAPPRVDETVDDYSKDDVIKYPAFLSTAANLTLDPTTAGRPPNRPANPLRSSCRGAAEDSHHRRARQGGVSHPADRDMEQGGQKCRTQRRG